MVFLKNIACKVMLSFMFIACSNSLIASVNRIVKRSASTVSMCLDHSKLKPLASYYGFVGHESLQLGDDVCSTKKSKLKTNMFDLQRSYDDECHEVLMAPGCDQKGASTRGFIFDAIAGKYKQKYSQEHHILQPALAHYHEQRYPEICKDLTINESDEQFDSLRKLYEKNYKNYIQASSIGAYYNLAKCANAVELKRESAQERIDIKDYIFDFVHYKNRSGDKYELNSVQFSDYPAGIPVIANWQRINAEGIYDPTSCKVAFSAPIFNRKSLTERAFLMMHEIGHAKQSSSLHDARDAAESDADWHAVQQCNCPICLQVMGVVSNERPGGYFAPKDYNRAANCAQHRCKAHSQYDTTELEKALACKDKYQVKELDNSMGTMYDRLPIVPKIYEDLIK